MGGDYDSDDDDEGDDDEDVVETHGTIPPEMLVGDGPEDPSAIIGKPVDVLLEIIQGSVTEEDDYVYMERGQCEKLRGVGFPVGSRRTDFTPEIKLEAERWCNENPKCVGFYVPRPANKRNQHKRGVPVFCKSTKKNKKKGFHFWVKPDFVPSN